MQSFFSSTLHPNKQLRERKLTPAGAQREYDIFMQIHKKKHYRNFQEDLGDWNEKILNICWVPCWALY